MPPSGKETSVQCLRRPAASLIAHLLGKEARVQFSRPSDTTRAWSLVGFFVRGFSLHPILKEVVSTV